MQTAFRAALAIIDDREQAATVAVTAGALARAAGSSAQLVTAAKAVPPWVQNRLTQSGAVHQSRLAGAQVAPSRGRLLERR